MMESQRTIGWRCGFEIELMAPRGKSRETLACSVASAAGGKVTRCFYPQSEVDTQKKVAGYETLTLAFSVKDGSGRTLAVFADDITLNADLDLDNPGAAGWYRILATRKETLDLVEAQCDATAPLDEVLVPLATLYRTEQRAGPEGMRIVDSASSTLAVALPLAGDRERACEIITRPLEEAHLETLTGLLEAARAEGFFVPKESATHIHFDGAALSSARAVRNLVAIFHRYRLLLRDRYFTNSACLRLGEWPGDLLALVASSDFLRLDWNEARRAMDSTSIQKWCDFNLLNLVDPFARKRTFEVRILPTTLDAASLVDTARDFERLLRHATAEAALASPFAVTPTLAVDEAGRVELETFLRTGKGFGGVRAAASTATAPTPAVPTATPPARPTTQGFRVNLSSATVKI